ncbi:hypothetical protein Peur_031013 [Populus x canadensis]
MGSVGRGGRPSSLTSRIGSYLGNIKFTHCLVPFHTNPNISSKMYSGDGSEIIGKGVVSTPLVRKKNSASYYVALEGISVRGKFLAYISSGTISKGNVFNDIAAPPAILPKDFYNRLEQEVKNSIPVTPYLHFDEGARVPATTFISPKQDVFCFAMTITDAFMPVACFARGLGSFLLFRPRTLYAMSDRACSLVAYLVTLLKAIFGLALTWIDKLYPSSKWIA